MLFLYQTLTASFQNKMALLRKGLKKERTQRLNTLLIEGYQHSRKEDRSLNKEWEKTSIDPQDYWKL